MENTHIPPLVELSGSPYERGLAHGQAVKGVIERNIAFYQKLLKCSDDSILRVEAAKCALKIASFRPEFMEEMHGIAEGAGVDREYIYMLNARTELLAMNDIVQSECATFYFKNTGLLFENWDWSEPSKDMTVLLSITLPDGRHILTFTEAGMLGKVGMSSAGFGVAFNYLYPNAPLTGVPIHALLRALLEASSFMEASALLSSDDCKGTSGNILLGDASGNAVNFELSGTTVSRIPVEEKFFAHTNHYLGGTENHPEAGAGFLHNSFARHARAQAVLTSLTSYDVSDAQGVLTEQGPGDGMLCRDFIPEEPGHTMGTGTIASLIMDIPRKVMYVALDPQHSKEFRQYPL